MLYAVNMKYQNVISLLDNATTKPSRFRARHWTEINT